MEAKIISKHTLFGAVVERCSLAALSRFDVGLAGTPRMVKCRQKRGQGEKSQT